MNKVILIGRLTADPKLTRTSTDKNCVLFKLAINEGKDKASFLPCVVWNEQAENLVKYCKKGSMIGVEGKVSHRSTQDQQGNWSETTKISAARIEYLGGGLTPPQNQGTRLISDNSNVGSYDYEIRDNRTDQEVRNNMNIDDSILWED